MWVLGRAPLPRKTSERSRAADCMLGPGAGQLLLLLPLSCPSMPSAPGCCTLGTGTGYAAAVVADGSTAVVAAVAPAVVAAEPGPGPEAVVVAKQPALGKRRMAGEAGSGRMGLQLAAGVAAAVGGH